MSTHHTCIYNCGGSDCDAPPQLRPARPEGVTVREPHSIRSGDIVQLIGASGDATKLNGLYRIVDFADTGVSLAHVEQQKRKRLFRRNLWLGALAFGVAGLVAAVRWWLLR